MSGFWEIEASVSPAREILLDGSEQLLVRVQIVDLDSPDPAAHAFILAAADDADWQTEQDGCPEPAR
jgi:hypothetical protein